MKARKGQIGFTLIEVLVVVALIVVLVSMVLVATSKSRVDTQHQLTKATIRLLDTALQEYYDYTNNFPGQNSMEPDTAFDSDLSRRNACLYAQLNLVPDSRKILDRLADSQTLMVDDEVITFTDQWGTEHVQEGYMLILDAWGTVFDYLYDEYSHTFPVIMSAGPDKNFDTGTDNIDNRK